MAYFTISTGLRGCYMPDNCYTIRATTRRALKDALAGEARYYRDAGFVGANKRAIAHIAAIAWKEAHKPNPAYLPFALPLAPSHARDNYCHGIFVSTATRQEYKEYLAESESW